MRNRILKLAAAGLLLIAVSVGSWSWLHEGEPKPAPESAAKQEEMRRAQEIIDSVQRGQVGNARALADRFYRDFPNSPEIQNLERLTGYHPRPYGP
jgi:hypothetical protein